MLCDYGNRVKLHISNLRPLPPSLIGSFALECTVSDIRFPSLCQIYCHSLCTKNILHSCSEYYGDSLSPVQLDDIFNPEDTLESNCGGTRIKNWSKFPGFPLTVQQEGNLPGRLQPVM